MIDTNCQIKQKCYRSYTPRHNERQPEVARGKCTVDSVVDIV